MGRYQGTVIRHNVPISQSFMATILLTCKHDKDSVSATEDVYWPPTADLSQGEALGWPTRVMTVMMR